MQVYDVSATGALSFPNNDRKFIPDSNGNFSINFELSQPGYFKIGRNLLYLSPGDHLTIFIDVYNQKDAVFKGSHKDENDYLKSTPLPQGGSFINSGDNIRPTVEQSLDLVLKAAGDRKSTLNSFNNLSPQFKTLETVRLKADIINSLLKLSSYFDYKNHIPKDSLEYYDQKFLDEGKTYLDSYSKDLINTDYLNLPVYRDIIPYLLDQDKTHTKASATIEDFTRAETLVNMALKADSKPALTELKSSLKEITTPLYKSIVSDKIDGLLKFGKGDTALNFTATMTNGKEVNLKSYSGKTLIIDLWATWCGPCLEDIPYWEKLREQYKNDPNIIFISLSVDEDREKWKKKVNDMKNPGIQWIINPLKLNDYAISGYPTSIVIDRNFKVVTLHGPRPSSPQLDKLLKELL